MAGGAMSPAFREASGAGMDWFRFYHDVLDDPKVQRLPAPLFKMSALSLIVDVAQGVGW
jgi:hypothetical protein